jgi:hypothetical protein
VVCLTGTARLSFSASLQMGALSAALLYDDDLVRRYSRDSSSLEILTYQASVHGYCTFLDKSDPFQKLFLDTELLKRYSLAIWRLSS